jgi:hypothetical protein
MNYARLSLDELAVRCDAGDLEARAYAGEHLRGLMLQLEEQLREELTYDSYGYEIPDEILVFTLLESSPYWRIG